MPITRAPKKSKWYVVWVGYAPGLYPSWDKCREQVEGYQGAKFKAYDTLAEAKVAFESGPPIPAPKTPKTAAERAAEKTGPILPSICVDAACNMTTGVMEYRAVETDTGKELFRMGPFDGSSNNLGEFLAIVHALGMLSRIKSDLPIYSDSKTALSWVRNKHAKTTLVRSKKNAEVFALIQRAESWLKTKSFPNSILKWETDKWGENPADFGRKH